jgi:hypothetical protein
MRKKRKEKSYIPGPFFNDDPPDCYTYSTTICWYVLECCGCSRIYSIDALYKRFKKEKARIR